MRSAIAILVLLGSNTVHADIKVEGIPHGETYQLPDLEPRQTASWLESYVLFTEQQDSAGFALDYPQTARDLRAEQPEQRVRGIKVCAASGDLRSIPLIVAQLRNTNRTVQIQAGLALDRLVTDYELRRRDRSAPDRVRILPRAEGDVDLRPLRWVLVDMLRSGEPNLQAYAADMIGYLGLRDLEPTLRAIHQSRNPAAYRAVENALGQLDLTYKKRDE